MLEDSVSVIFKKSWGSSRRLCWPAVITVSKLKVFLLMGVNKPEVLSKSNLHKSPHLIITMAICFRNVDWRGPLQSKCWSESMQVTQRIVNIIHISLKMRERAQKESGVIYLSQICYILFFRTLRDKFSQILWAFFKNFIYLFI